MFSQATILIDRDPGIVYSALADLKRQMALWDNITVADLDGLENGVSQVNGVYRLGRKAIPCIVELHLTRPGAGLVTRMQTASGELAAEWRIMEEGDRTRVEVNIEGIGGGPASNINIRHLAPKLLARLKLQFDRS